MEWGNWKSRTWTVDADRGRGHGNKNYCYAHRRGLALETKPKTLKTFA